MRVDLELLHLPFVEKRKINITFKFGEGIYCLLKELVNDNLRKSFN